MPYLVRVSCPKCGRTYRYSSDEGDMGCPFADCALIDEDEE